MGWAAALGRLEAAPVILYAGSIAWVVGYDTIYAIQDIEDDALAGIKSSARFFRSESASESRSAMRQRFLLIGTAFVLAGPGSSPLRASLAFAAHLAWAGGAHPTGATARARSGSFGQTAMQG